MNAQPANTALSTREAYGDALRALGARYDFVVLDADLAKATKTDLFRDAYPARFFDMGIAEADMMSTAAGLAACGKTVFASTFAVFAAGRAFEQVRNAIACPALNVKIGATHGGVLIGEDGASHQCIEDLALMRALPNMTVIVPCDEASTRWAVEAALLLDGPVYLRFGRFASAPVYDSGAAFEVGKGVVLRDGGDVTIAAIGDMVAEALDAARLLENDGIAAAVIDLHTVKPLDRALLAACAARTGAVVTAEDHSVIGGLGGAVAEVLAEEGTARMRRVGVPDTFGTSGKRSQLAGHFGLTAGRIRQVCRELVRQQ